MSPRASLPDEGGVAPIRAPGGFPLLGIAGPQVRPDPRAAALLATSSPADRSEEPPRVSAPVVTARSSHRRRPSLALGMGVAAAVAFGLLLPDFIARLSPEPPRRPLPRLRRRRSARDDS